MYLSTVHVTTNVSVPITGWNNKLFPASHYLCNFTLMKTIIICFRCFKWQFRKNSLPNFQIIFFGEQSIYIFLTYFVVKFLYCKLANFVSVRSTFWHSTHFQVPNCTWLMRDIFLTFPATKFSILLKSYFSKRYKLAIGQMPSHSHS